MNAELAFIGTNEAMCLVRSGIERYRTDFSVTFYSFIPSLPKREVVIMGRKDRKLSKVMEALVSVIHSIEW